MTFTRNEVRGTHLVFFKKRRFQGLISEILRVVGLLGEKFTFFNSLGTIKISRSLRLPGYINVVLLINFQNNLNYASTSNIREVMKFYNVSDKTFETNFRHMRHWDDLLLIQPLVGRIKHPKKERLAE